MSLVTPLPKRKNPDIIRMHMHRRPNTIEQVDDDEVKLIEVRKHPIGLVIVYTQTAVGMLAAISLLFFIMPTVFEDQDAAFWMAGALSLFALLFAAIVLFISTYIFVQNRIIVTDRNITQILQFGLFSRKVSQLNIVNVEDVTSEQRGILQTALNYGVLKIETAGEQSNFMYDFCPNSGNVAKIILDTRERMLGQMDDGNTSSPGAKALAADFRVSKRGAKQAQTTEDNGEPNSSDPNQASSAQAASSATPTDKNSKTKKSRKDGVNVRGIGAEIVEHALDERSYRQ